MGRHADPDTRAFRRSVLVAVGRGAGALAAVTAVVIVLSQLGRSDAPGPIVVLNDPPGPALTGPHPDATETAEPLVMAEPEAGAGSTGVPTAPPTAEPTAEPTEEATAPQATAPAAPAPADTTVQVLDGVGDRRRAEAAVAVLRDLGYDVVAVNAAGVDYDVTTVLFTAGHEDAAESLRRRDARFAGIGPNRNLSEQVMIHVVVGRDWPSP